MEKVVIIGGVAAGATAAAKVRRISADAQITMIESGPDISFANCGLPYFIGGDIKNRSKLILQSPESFRDQYAVEVHTHTKVTAIDRGNKFITTVDLLTGDAHQIEYTKLILAQGGRPVKPTLPGAEMDHVFTLWTLEDMDKIAKHLEDNKPSRAVVIGGGFIGLEMVEALVKRGLHVDVVEMMPHVMSVMDAEIAGFIQAEMLAYGVGVRTGVGVSEIKHNTVLLNDGDVLDADMVLMSIGVRPTLDLAQDAGLALGDAGGLLVDEYMQTSDPYIYAAGDMVEIEHRVSSKKVRIPLAGPANRQGRIAAENIFGGRHAYKGSIGTSIVRVFDAVAGITGLSLKQARQLGIDADAVVVHKEHHTSYYPGAEQVTVMLVYEKNTGIVLGGQTAGYAGADRRLDVVAVAVANGLTISDLADLDYAYSPPLGTANDAINMVAFTAENKMSGFSPSLLVSDLDEFESVHYPVYIDVRDVFAFEKSHVSGAVNIPLEILKDKIKSLPIDRPLVVYDETGKKGHQALRMLIGAGFENVFNVSGGNVSIQRQARAHGFYELKVQMLEIQLKSVNESVDSVEFKLEDEAREKEGLLIVDVRTAQEYAGGAFPGAINIALDDIMTRLNEFGADKDREILVYCASGGRSAYAQRLLKQAGYNNIKNGGGISQMMANKDQILRERPEDTANEKFPLLVVDVRTVDEFRSGAYPGALNIPLDDLVKRISEFGDKKDREIVVYCASGGRSAYAQRILNQYGFTNVRNGGGIMQMMMSRK